MVVPVDPAVGHALSRVGAVLREKWRLDALIGVGGMAAVYAGTHRNGSRGAIKVLHPELARNQNVRSRFLREGYVANTVGHKGAVSVLDDDVTEDGGVFLVMELLEGESLEARASRLGGRMDPAELLSIADQWLDVLAAAHAKGIVHRDLKPENVFVTADGQLKVLDFGIAKVRALSSASTATRTGTSMGTPAFMAPEQARGRWESVDAQTDLWAVGASMFTLLSGRLVHQEATINETLLAAMTKPAPSLAEACPGTHRAVAAVVDRALAFQKQDRWADAAAMQNGVREAYHRAFRAPITTAPSISVPPLAADLAKGRTLGPNQQAATTGGAVVAGSTGVPIGRSPSRRGMMLALGVGALAAVAVVIVMALAIRRTGAASDGPVTTTVASAVATLPTEASVVASVAPSASASASEPSVVDVGSLPVAGDPDKSRPAPAGSRPPPIRPSSAVPTKPPPTPTRLPDSEFDKRK